MKKNKSISEKLKDANYKLTKQRQEVIKVLEANPQTHWSVEDLHGIFLNSKSDIGLTTIYRTLDMLENIGIVQKIYFGDGRTRYELNESSEEKHHHHLICVSCGKVTEFRDDLLTQLEQSIAALHEFKITEHQVQFLGYCKECQGDKK